MTRVSPAQERGGVARRQPVDVQERLQVGHLHDVVLVETSPPAFADPAVDALSNFATKVLKKEA